MIVLVMGVAGSGKTTVGQALAKQLGARFLEGDAFHTPANRSKMGRGIPLTDEDRGPWLEAIREAMVQAAGEGEPVVVACSALKHRYRRRLTAGVVPSPWFVHLTLDRAEATRRLRSRKDHFMPATLADSQFAALEPPHGARVIEIEATWRVDRIVQELTRRIREASGDEPAPRAPP